MPGGRAGSLLTWPQMSGEKNCAVCGRTILAGERVRGYASPDGPRTVCALCEAGAEQMGWRVGEAVEEDAPIGEPKRRPGLAARLRLPRRARRDPEPAPPPGVEDDDPAAAGMRGAAPAEPPALHPFERAAIRFNASEAGRTVAGLARTLGDPLVSVGAAAGTPGEVRITVAWELSWYQWGVDLGDELRPVYELKKGFEVEEIDAAARQWNASAQDGRVVMVAPPRRAAANGRPVHR
jgi:hypothetical protein